MSDQVKETSDKIKVAVRVRPLIEREKNSNVAVNWKVSPPNEIYQVDKNECVIDGTQYVFDRVFSFMESNLDVYNEICKDVVNSVFNGMHGTIFAYGQTSSGKTFTMSGNEIEEGVILQAINDIFSLIETVPEREYLLRVSFMEIYNEVVSDLLVENLTRLEIKENTNKEIFVDGLTEQVVSTPEDVMKLLSLGHGKRQVRDTAMNERSSRSHAIFRMIIESKLCDSGNDGAVQVSHLNLVDLAGSEPAGQMGTTGPRFTEGVNINQSLLNLGTLIKALSQGQPGVYRNSKLTRILQNSLGGNARTAIICNVTPTSIEQTQSTIKFAKRAKTICNKPRVNEVLSDQAQLQKHKRKIQDLEKELRLLKSNRGAKDDVKKELQEKNRRIEELELLAKDLKGNVLVSSMTPKMLARKQRRETWGGHLGGFGKTGLIAPDFPPMKLKSLSQSQFDTGCAGSPILRARLDVPIPIKNCQDLAPSSSSSNVTNRKPKTKEVRFISPPLTNTDFSSPIYEESFRESDVFEDALRIAEQMRKCGEKQQLDEKEAMLRLNLVTTQMDNLKTESSNEIAKLRESLKEKDAIINKLENQIKHEILSFSSVERFCEAEMDVNVKEFLDEKTQFEIKLQDQRKIIDELTLKLENEIKSRKDSEKFNFELETKLESYAKSATEVQGQREIIDELTLKLQNEVKSRKDSEQLIFELETKLESKVKSSTDLEVKLQGLLKTIEELTSKLENENKSRKDLEQLNFELETKLESKEKSSSNLEVQLQGHIKTIEELKSKIENEIKTRNDKEQLISELKTELKSKSSTEKELLVQGHRETIDELMLRLDSEIKIREDLETKVVGIKSELERTKNNLVEARNKLIDMEKRESDLELQLEESKVDADKMIDLVIQLDDITSSKSELQVAFDFLKNQLEVATQKIEELKKREISDLRREEIEEKLSRIQELEAEIEAYEFRVDMLVEENEQSEKLVNDLKSTVEGLKKLNDVDKPKKQEASQQCDHDINLRLNANPNCCLEKEMELTKALEEISAQNSLITVLKYDLEEEQLKFKEYFEDITEERLQDSRYMLKLGKENQALIQTVEELKAEILNLTTENQNLNEKILNIERQLANNVDDDRINEIKSLTKQLYEERSRRCEAESKLTNESKRCESLKRECKSYDDKIYNLSIQLRKTQSSLNETILPSKKTSPLKEVAAVSSHKMAPSVEHLGNIGAMQVIEVQRQLYHLQQHCKDVEEQNGILRQKYKELKKRYSSKPTKSDEKENQAVIKSSEEPKAFAASSSDNPFAQPLIPINQLPQTPTQKFNTVTDYSDFTLTIKPNEQIITSVDFSKF